MIPININDYVFVRLTDVGKAILKAQNCPPPAENEDGYGKWQLWILMNTFGPHLNNGSPIPFETTIYLP
jgi:hypothetical protein